VPDIDAVLEEPARHFYDNVASSEQRQRIDQIIRGLCSDPSIDGVATFAFHIGVPEPDARLYLDDEFRILYRLANAWTISILNIGFDGVPPQSRRDR